MEGLLKNNSNEMGTIVETFLIEETVGLIYDNDQLDQWNERVKELGLQGQTQIVTKDKSPIPFMHLKQGLVNTFETLCPRKYDVKDYNLTPIPLEILDLIALSFKEKYFEEVQIWHDDKSPDPVCLGLKKEYYSYMYDNGVSKSGSYTQLKCTKEERDLNKEKPNHYFSGDTIIGYYLIGKWADVKRSFSELIKMATERYIQEASNEFNKKIKEAQRGLDDLSTQAFDRFGSTVNGSDEDLLF